MTAPKRVLIAEDEALIRLDLSEMLAEEGFEVVGQAVDGEQAVAMATELRPDLVIMDVKMPRLDGISAAEQIARERIAPEAAHIDETDAFPRQLMADAGRLGLLGVTIPCEWGGAGRDYVAYANRSKPLG